MLKRLIAVNERGQRIGQDHPAAVLSDADVDNLRRLHEEEGYGYRRLAKLFDVSRSQVRDICLYRKRCQRAERFKPSG